MMITINGTPLRELLTRKQAAERIRTKYGIGCTAETLATKAWNCSGPPFVRVGNISYYLPSDVDDYARAKISALSRRARNHRNATDEVAA